MLESKPIKTVDDYLNEVDYEEMKNYKPSQFAIEYMNFLKVISVGLDMNSSPPVHYKMIDGLANKKRYLANLCSRGLSKTTLFGEILILYLAVYRYIPNFGVCDTAIYVTDSMENGAKSLRKNIESRYYASSQLQALLPKAKFTDAYIEFENAGGGKFGVRLFGAKSGIRGTKIFGNRPVLAIFDDLVSDEDATSPTILEKINDTIYKGVIPALDPNKRKIIFNGTPFNKSDPLYQAIESGGWEVNVYPVCEKFPCKPSEFKGAWESRFGYETLKEDYDMFKKTGKIKAFKQEMMLRIASEEDRVIKVDDLRWFNSFDIMNQKQRYNFYITTDFATSTQKRADYTVIGVWAVDSKQNRYLVDGKIGRQLMNETFNDLFKFAKKYNPMSVGIEVTGQQGAFLSLLREEMIKRNIYFPLAKGKGTNKEGIGTKANKMERFRLTVPAFKENKIFLPQDMKDSILIQEILEELSFVTIDGIKAQHDDALDMISQLDQMHVIYPDSYQATLKKESQANDPFFNGSSVLDVYTIHSSDEYLV